MWFDALVELKKRSQKTTKQISDESGIPIGTLNKLFAGQTKDPKLDTIRSVVHTLGFTLDDLEMDIKKPSSSTDQPVLAEGVITLEQSNTLLTALGLIQEGDKISDDDLMFLEHIMGLLEAWFRKGH